MFKKALMLVKISFIIFSILFFLKIDLTKLNLFNQNQLIAVMILLIFHLSRILRLHLIFYFMNKKIKFVKLLDIYYIGLYLGIITPGRLGEFYRIKLINDLNISKLSNYNLMLIEKIIDIFSVIFFINIFMINSIYTLEANAVALLITIFFLTIIFLNFGYKLFLLFIKKTIYFFPIFKNKQQFEFFFKNNPFQDLGIQKLIILYLFTIASWTLFIYAVHLGIQSVEMEFFKTLEVFVVNTFITALPITIMGIGLREFVLIEIMDVQNLYLVAKISLQFIFFNIISILPGIILYFKKESKIL